MPMGQTFELKKSNILAVFHALQKYRSLSRRELEDITGLSWGSISQICSDLIKRGIITAEKEIPLSGRPPERLTVCLSKNLSLGIDINSIGLSFNVVNLAGVSVFSVFFSVENCNKNTLISILEEKTEAILNKYPDILSINLAMQGTLDRKQGISIRSNFFKDWENVPIVEIFEQKFGIKTFLYHDPECLLTFHSNNDARLKDRNTGIIIRVDDGIGMAQLLNGSLYESNGNPVCELGHTIIVPNGIPCPCGKRGCLEVYCSLRGMKNIYNPDENFSSEKFISLILAGDKKATEIMEQASIYLGLSIANLFTLYDPEFILVDGKAIVRLPVFFELIAKNVGSFCDNKFNLLKAIYRKDAAAIGAAMLTIDKQLEEVLF